MVRKAVRASGLAHPTRRERDEDVQEAHISAAQPTPFRYIAWAVLLFIYSAWFGLLGAGIRSYEGEPVRVKLDQLPLHGFDKLFRTAGAGILFIMWALRAVTTHGLPAGVDHSATVWWPCGAYALQAAARWGLYVLHRAGLIFAPQRWDWAWAVPAGHPPHIMSDHILLAATVVGGLACEAVMPLLSLRHAESESVSASLRSYAKLATVLAGLVSWESYYTARYFHPPSEIVIAAVLGFVVFQAPLLLFTLQAVRKASAKPVEPAQVVAGAATKGD